MRRYVRQRREQGASLIEFALLAPFLLLLIFGMIEFAWLFSQNLDVRHGAREGARLIAVNYPYGPDGRPAGVTADDQKNAIVAEICSRMDVATNGLVTLQWSTDPVTGDVVGGTATAKVDAPANTLTGFLDWAIPATMRLASEVDIRIEQPPTWNVTTEAACT